MKSKKMVCIPSEKLEEIWRSCKPSKAIHGKGNRLIAWKHGFVSAFSEVRQAGKEITVEMIASTLYSQDGKAEVVRTHSFITFDKWENISEIGRNEYRKKAQALYDMMGGEK